MKRGDLVILRDSLAGGVNLYNDFYMSNYSPGTHHDPRVWRSGVMFNPEDVGIVLDESILSFSLYNKILVPGGVGWIFSHWMEVVG